MQPTRTERFASSPEHCDSDIAAAIQAGLDQVQVIDVPDNHRPVIVHPGTHAVSQLEREKLIRPRFLTAEPLFHEVQGFIAYLNDFKDECSRIWHDGQGGFLAVLDYHQSREPDARHADHRARLSLKRSPEWNAWTGQNGQPMSQVEFGEFIEDHARDVLDQLDALTEVASGLQATSGATFKSAFNQANGSIGIHWDEEVQGRVAGKDMEVPNQFQVGLRPFYGCERYPIDCRLRYRIPSGHLKLFFKCLHLEPITEAAIEAIVLRVRDETGIEPRLGSAELGVVAKGQ